MVFQLSNISQSSQNIFLMFYRKHIIYCLSGCQEKSLKGIVFPVKKLCNVSPGD